MDNLTLVLFIAFTMQANAFFEVSITNGHPMILNEKKFVNLDKLRVKKVNKTGHYVVGEIDIFIELSNAYQVCRIERFLILNSSY